MKKLLLILWMATTALLGFGQVRIDQTTTQLASKYYSEGDYSKAAPLFRDIYASSGNPYYFSIYIQCMVQLGQFEQAEKDVKNEIRKSKTPPPELFIHHGYILKAQKRDQEAQAKYEEAIAKIPKNKSAYINAANIFNQWREYEFAERVYQIGKKELPGEKFHSELSQVYLYLRNYSQLMDELLEQVKTDEQQLPQVESILTSALYLDIENDLREEFKAVILKRIQAEPDVTGFNRLLIWFFLQEKQFPAALRQSIALDRRTRQEERQILSLAQMALNNRNYQDAVTAYEYIMAKGKENPSWYPAFFNKMHADYLQFTTIAPVDLTKAGELAEEFKEGLEILGYNAQNIFLIREYAHLLSFHLGRTEEAVQVIEKGMSIPALKPPQIGELKSELGDIYVYAGDPWEATLLYSQVIDANRDNALGDEVKLKKARLGYYLGNFSWAKAQLDVLKASTSKLTANDAMELALFISNNSDLDTTEVPLHYFARADYLFFMNRNQEALVILDSIATLFPSHALVDDLLLRKARIAIRGGNYSDAAVLLTRIAAEFPAGLLADDALFLLAETLEEHLHDPAKAADAYKRILFDYPGSIYVTEARERYRALNGDPPEIKKSLTPGSETIFFNEGNQK